MGGKGHVIISSFKFYCKKNLITAMHCIWSTSRIVIDWQKMYLIYLSIINMGTLRQNRQRNPKEIILTNKYNRMYVKAFRGCASGKIKRQERCNLCYLEG